MTKNSFVLFYFTSANTKRSFALTNSMKLKQGMAYINNIYSN